MDDSYALDLLASHVSDMARTKDVQVVVDIIRATGRPVSDIPSHAFRNRS
jgi:hypothetical protein